MKTPTKFLLTALAVVLIGLLIFINLWSGIIVLLLAFALYLLREYLQKSFSYGNIIFWVIVGCSLLILLGLHLGIAIRFIFSMIGIYVLIKLIEWIWIRTIQDEQKDPVCFLRWLFGNGNSLFNRGK